MTSSPYAQVGAKLVDSGFAAIPCRPGSKVPGAYRSGEWFYELEWQRFCDRLPTELELGVWAKWPDAGICVALGGEHGLVAIDIDTDQHEIVEAILGALPCESPVQKCGKKGANSFLSRERCRQVARLQCRRRRACSGFALQGEADRDSADATSRNRAPV